MRIQKRLVLLPPNAGGTRIIGVWRTGGLVAYLRKRFSSGKPVRSTIALRHNYFATTALAYLPRLVRE